MWAIDHRGELVWAILELGGIIVDMAERAQVAGMQTARDGVDAISLEGFAQDPNAVFRSLHPCALCSLDPHHLASPRVWARRRARRHALFARRVVPEAVGGCPGGQSCPSVPAVPTSGRFWARAAPIKHVWRVTVRAWYFAEVFIATLHAPKGARQSELAPERT